jgi:phenol 2-monooxygenase
VSLKVDIVVVRSSLALVRRALKTAGRFMSGIGVRYADSAIVNSKHQSHAQHLVIGERVPPQMVVCAADGGPYELQDLLPSDTRFKVLLFVGDTLCAEQLSRVNVLAGELLGKGGILLRYAPRDLGTPSVFDILTLSTASLKTMRAGDLPKSLRFHWSK